MKLRDGIASGIGRDESWELVRERRILYIRRYPVSQLNISCNFRSLYVCMWSKSTAGYSIDHWPHGFGARLDYPGQWDLLQF